MAKNQQLKIAEKLFSQALAYQPCVVHVTNKGPAGAVITGAVIIFTYLDKTTSQVSNPRLNIRMNDPPADFFSEPKCVVKIYWAVYVTYNGTKSILDATDVVPPGKCAVDWEVGIQPVGSVLLKDFEEGAGERLRAYSRGG